MGDDRLYLEVSKVSQGVETRRHAAAAATAPFTPSRPT